MKKLFLIPVLSALLFSAHAQIPLDSFYKKGATWCDYESYVYEPGKYFLKPFTCYIGNDTVINSVSYHLVRVETFTEKKTTGGIRVDSQKVYFLKLDTLSALAVGHTKALQDMPYYTDILLYDYNLKVGDSLTWKTGPFKKVVEIDSIQLSNGPFIKRYYFYNPGSLGAYTEYWLEGPGASTGFLGSLYFYTGASNAFYHQSAFAIANPNAAGSSVCFPTAVEATHKEKSEFAVFPNPLTENRLQIKTPASIISLTILDLTGKMKYACYKLPAGNHSLNVSLEAGVYFMNARFEDGTIVNRKLLKL